MVSAEVDRAEMELDKLLNEKVLLQQAVDSQEISPADVDRMNSERDSLSISLNQLAAKQDELNAAIWEKEIEIQREMDKLEACVKGFNSLAAALGLGSYQESQQKRFELSLNLHSTRSESMLNLDIKNVVKVRIV